MYNPKGDPRVVYARLAAFIPEERFAEWERTGACLCGCGTLTKPLHSRPSDARSYWALHHAQRFLRACGIPRPNGTKPPGWHQNVAHANRTRRYVDAVAIAELVQEHLDAQWRGKVRPFAWAHDFEPEQLRKIVRKQTKFITKRTADRLLVAIGEPLRKAA